MKSTELYHWGIKGQKWGIRRYQNKDGSLTPAGRKRYAEETEKAEAAKGSVSVEKSVKKAINSGNIDDVTKWRKDMTNDELKKALERVDLEKKVVNKNSEISTRRRTTMGTKKVARSFSEDDLDRELARLKKEKEYVDLATAINQNGRSAASKTISKIGNELVVKYMTKAAGGLTDTGLRKLATINPTLDKWLKILKWVE